MSVVVNFLGWAVIILGALSLLIPLGIVLTRGRIVDKIDRAINPVTGRKVKRVQAAYSSSVVHETVTRLDGSEEHVFHA